MTGRLALGLLLLTALRLALAAGVPLSPDEAYYWVWSRALAPGYLDHPPMVALWIRAGTSLAGDGALGVRLLGPLSVALGSVLLADAADRLLPGRRAGIAAAALLNATLAVGLGAVIMTPDTPLLFFWVAALWALARLLDSRSGAWLLAVGLFAGLALDSKYTALLLGVGVVLWVLLVPSERRWLASPWFWLGGLLALALFAPVLAWNAAHGWASFLKQGGRAGAWDPGRAARFLGELVAGQFGLATPLIFALFVAGATAAAARAWRGRDPAATLLTALIVPPLLVFLEHALGDRVQGNWPVIVYPAAAVAAGGLRRPVWSRLRLPAAVLGFSITLAVYIQAALSPLPLSPRLDPSSRQLAGWPDLARRVEAIAGARAAAFVAADEYGLAAELARNLPDDLAVLGAKDRWRLVRLPLARDARGSGLLLRSLRRGDDVDRTPWSEIEPIGTVERTRDGASVEGYRVYRVVPRPPDPGGTVPPPLFVLPRPGDPSD